MGAGGALLDNVVSWFDHPRRTDRGAMVRCPAHEDKRQSLHVSQGDDGRVLLKCHAGCDTTDVLARVGKTLADLFPPRERDHPKTAPPVLIAYDYRDEHGDLLYQAVRKQYPDRKDFYQRRPAAGGGWINNLKDVRRVLYRRPELLAADPNEVVLILEGEKDCDRAARDGWTATTNVGGAGKWRDDYSADLAGRHVVLFPDNDQPGYAHMLQVARSLEGAAASVTVVRLTAVPEKGDLSDALDAGLTWAALDPLVTGQRSKILGAELIDLATLAELAGEPPAKMAGTDPKALLGQLTGKNPNGTVAAVALVADSMGGGEKHLDAVYAFLGRFVSYPSDHARIAHTLWVAHTHLMDAFESTPRLAFLSPEPASGKSRAMEVTEPLVPNPVEAVNVTPAYLFRKVGSEAGRPTVLYDEIDTVFGPKAKDNEEVRGLLNAGHRIGAVAGRCVVRGKTVDTEEISAYCAVALAGLGDLPDTILTRSVIVRMRRRAPSEQVEPYRRRVHAPEGHHLRDGLAAWAATVRDQITNAWPELPAGIEDRDADVWEPLITVADAAGGAWPQRARVAAVALVADSKESTPSLGIRLLDDIRTLYGLAEVMSTDDILAGLHGLDEAPWGELMGGKPLNSRGLASRLGRYGVKSKNVRIGERVLKGYARADLMDAWSRYLSLPPHETATSATSATRSTDPEPAAAWDDIPAADQNGHADTVGAAVPLTLAGVDVAPAGECRGCGALTDGGRPYCRSCM